MKEGGHTRLTTGRVFASSKSLTRGQEEVLFWNTKTDEWLNSGRFVSLEEA